MADFLILPSKLDTNINIVLLYISAILILLLCFRLIISKTLLESVIIMSAFSLFIGICYLFMDAPDVAMTETALGACLSTCVLLNLIRIFGDEESQSLPPIRKFMTIILCVILIGFLIFASLDLPPYGKAETPVQSHLTKFYMEHTKVDIAIPSVVSAILASYRGFDTLGETSVILIAGLAVILILARRKK